MPQGTTTTMSNTKLLDQLIRRSLLATLLITLTMARTRAQSANVDAVTIVPADAKFHGRTYGEWSAEFWQYALALPVEGHPFLDTPEYDFSAGQKGSVWFWSQPDGPITRSVTLPAGKALFLTIRDVEVSSIEEPPFFGATEAEQREGATWFGDRIVDVFCVINGEPVENLDQFRVSSPQFKFRAPTPWIFGETGGKATAVSDGSFLMLLFPKGRHTIEFGGTFRFAPGELGDDGFDLPHEGTIELTVE